MFSLTGPVAKDASLLSRYGTTVMPIMYTSPQDELLACRQTAWLGSTLNLSPVYDVSGPDAVKLFNYVSVNRDYSKLKVGGSRHMILCNERGQMLADGVLMRREEDLYRSYWLAPVLAYYVDTLGYDVQGHWVTDEFFFQIDGPRSLEIMEKAAHEDLHDLKFAQHKHITVAGIPATIHRLGMSGCLAYEMHGDMKDAEAFFQAIVDAGEEYGLRKLGLAQYPRNHTQGGYPNQNIHYYYPILDSGEELANYVKNSPMKLYSVYNFAGSAADDPQNAFVTPFDVKWEYLINWDHEFIGKEALLELKADPKRTCVTLEWDPDDVAQVFATQFRGTGVKPVDDISSVGDGGAGPFVMSKVLDDSGAMVGMTAGRTHDFYHQRMISLAFVNLDQAELGNTVTVVWGTDPANQMPIKAKVAEFPYYNEEYRNETFDVEKIPHPVFED